MIASSEALTVANVLESGGDTCNIFRLAQRLLGLIGGSVELSGSLRKARDV